MAKNKDALLRKGKSVHWATPEGVYDALNREFRFTFDPCPLHGKGGLERPFGKRNYINPPYGPEITKWLAKAIVERQKGRLSVFLLPARTDTRWFHELVLPHANEIRFIKGRLKFGEAKNSAPFPSMIVIFEPIRNSAIITKKF